MSTIITSYSVGLGLDASDYIRNSSLSRQETAALKRDINAARSPAENYARKLRSLEKALNSGAIEQRTFNRLVDSARQKLQRASTAAGGMAGSQQALVQGFGKLKAAGAAFLSVAVAKNVTTFALQSAADAEQAAIKFEVLTKSADTAKVLIGQLQSFAASTPFQLPQIQQAAGQLLAFGFSANQVVGQLKNLGNIAAATGTPINELADIVGKMRVQNTIYSEDLNQLAGRGINVFEGLADKLGTTTDRVKKFASEGRIEFSTLNEVLNELGANEFGGMMERQAETAAGAYSTLTDSLRAASAEFGQLAMNATGATESMKSGTSWIQKLTKGLQVLKGAHGGVSLREQVALAELKASEEDLFRRRQVHENRQRKQAETEAEMRRQQMKQQEPERFARLDATAKTLQKVQGALTGIAAGVQHAFSDTEMLEKVGDDLAKLSQDDIRERKRDQLQLEKAITKQRERYNQLVVDNRLRNQEEQLRRIQQLEQDIAQGPGSGIRAGSSQAVAFLARQENQRIAAQAARNANFQPSREQIERGAKEAAELKKLQDLQKRQHEELVALQTAQLEAQKNNGFRRVR